MECDKGHDKDLLFGADSHLEKPVLFRLSSATTSSRVMVSSSAIMPSYRAHWNCTKHQHLDSFNGLQYKAA